MVSKLDEKMDLQEIEKKAYRSTFQDGLLEIEIGVWLLGAGIINYFYDLLLPAYRILLIPAIVFLALLFYWIGKKFITHPRIGIARFESKRGYTKNDFWQVGLSAYFAATFLNIIPIHDTNLFNLELGGVFIIALLFITLPLSLFAYKMEVPRLYIIAVLYGLSWPFAEILHNFIGAGFDGLIPFGVIGSSVIIMGLVYLIRFLRKYPSLSKEIADGSQ